MRNFFYKIAGAIARFMYGRNGPDQLNTALLAAYIAVWVLRTVVLAVTDSAAARFVLELLALALAIVWAFRTFSKNLPKRRAENEKFLAWWRPIKNRVAGARQRRLDKEHRYFTCKGCGAVCRVPAGKGKIEITCPRCGNKIVGKS